MAAADQELTAGAREREHQHIGFALMLAFFALGPALIYPVFLMKVMCFALFACAFNLLIGYVGLLSFGHAMFLGIAGYVAAHTAKVWGLTPELAILAGAAAACGLGIVSGLLAIRRQGIYFAMITLALAQMVYFFCVQAPFTGGEDGIQAVPRGRLFGIVDLSDVTAMYVTVFVIFIGGFLLIYRIIHSPFGQVLKAIRENEPRAISLGYDVDRYKLLAYVISATLAGVAGATNALVFQLAALNAVHWTMSGEVVLMTLVGGLGTVFGPVVGALVLLAMENYLAQLGAWVTIVQGFIFVVCVLTFRRGIIGELMAFLNRSRLGHTQIEVAPERRVSLKLGAGIAGILLGIFSLTYVGIFGSMIGGTAGWLGAIPFRDNTLGSWAEMVSMLSWLAPLLTIVGGIVTFSNPRVGGIILGIGAFLHWYLLGFSQAGKLFVLPIGATAVLAVFASPSTSLFKRFLS